MSASKFLRTRDIINLIVLPDDPDLLATPLVYICFSDIVAPTSALSIEWSMDRASAPASNKNVGGVFGVFSVGKLDAEVDPDKQSHSTHTVSSGFI
jgi:hypothetical protein